MNGKHYTYRFKQDKEKKLNFTYHPETNTYTTPPVERKSTSPPKLDDQRQTPEKGDSPIPDTPPRLDLEENRDPDPDKINLNPIGPESNSIPEVNPIVPEGPVIPNIPEVIPEPNPEAISEVIPEDPEPLESEPEVIPPERNKDPIEFVYQFENFLRYINHNVEDPASVEKALSYLDRCLIARPETGFKPMLDIQEQLKIEELRQNMSNYQRMLKGAFTPWVKQRNNLRWLGPILNGAPPLRVLKSLSVRYNSWQQY